MRWLRNSLLLLMVLLAGPLLVAASNQSDAPQSWHDADRSSAGLAPLAQEHPDALVLVYAARTFGWRGNFAVHTWIAFKPEGGDDYTVLEVTGWGGRALQTRQDLPDRLWYGNTPQLLGRLQGDVATRAIAGIESAVADYPFADDYRAWPGPNSNTFTAWVIRQVPELQVVLPNTAIGKDHLGSGLLAATPSNSGLQVSLGGYLGLAAGLHEGLELNLLGLAFGIDPLSLAIKLPGLGHVGWRDPWSG